MSSARWLLKPCASGAGQALGWEERATRHGEGPEEHALDSLLKEAITRSKGSHGKERSRAGYPGARSAQEIGHRPAAGHTTPGDQVRLG